MRSRSRGWPLANPPQNEREEALARETGFVQSGSGEWFYPEPNFSPPLWVLKKYGPGHTCKACRSSFRSKKARDPYCLSCRTIMKEKQNKVEAILQVALAAPEEQRAEAGQRVMAELACNEPGCVWESNKGRYEPEDIRLVLDCLPGWVEAAHRHFMRHAFWNRFPYSPRFTPRLTPEKKEFYYGRRLWQQLERNQIMMEIRPLCEVPFRPNSQVTISLVDGQVKGREDHKP